MEDKLEEILKQYPFQVLARKRTRGAFLLDTTYGLRLLKESGASPARILFEESIKQRLMDQGYIEVDKTCRNKKEEYLTKDLYHNHWVVRHWYPGNECNIRENREILRGARHLGRLHKMLYLGKDFQIVSETGEDQPEENPAIQPYEQKESIPQEMQRHNAELKRVRSYIRRKRQKNEMEICLLNAFETFYQQAGLAQTLLRESGYEAVWDRTVQQKRICHGNYTYHNILFDGTKTITTNFDRAQVGLQIRDLYDFLRKVMEKNGWRGELGRRIIDAYQSERALEDGEGEILYALLLYPEKYWKLVNFYYNGRKSWMPAKNLEKLLRIRGQQDARNTFLEEIKGVLF